MLLPLVSDHLPSLDKTWICTNLLLANMSQICKNGGLGQRWEIPNAVPEGLRTRVVCKFSCASCNACYVGGTSRHFSTRVREHLLSDRSSNVFKHLQGSEFCRASCTPDCFEILDSAATKYQVKLKESMFIKWEKPDLNQQVKHINLTLPVKN